MSEAATTTPKVNPAEEAKPAAAAPAQAMVHAPEPPRAIVTRVERKLPEGLEGLDADDFVIPRVKIVQPTSRIDGAKPGTFYDTITKTCVPELHCAVLRVAKGRVMFPPVGQGDDPLCRSNDGYAPDPSVAEPFSHACIVRGPRGGKVPACNMAKWTAEGPPPCAETYVLLAVHVATTAPFLFVLQRTAYRAGKEFNTAVVNTGRPSRDLVVTIRLREETNAKGRFYVPVFSEPVAVDPPGKYDAAYAAYALTDLSAAMEADTEHDAAPPPERNAPPPRDPAAATRSAYGPPLTDPMRRADPAAAARPVRMAPSVARDAAGKADPVAPWEEPDATPPAGPSDPWDSAPGFLRGIETDRRRAEAVHFAPPEEREAALTWIAAASGLPLADGFEGWALKVQSRNFYDMAVAWTEARRRAAEEAAKAAAPTKPDADLPF